MRQGQKVADGPTEPARLITRSYIFAILAVHAFFVSYHMSIVEVPRALEDEPDWLVGIVVGGLGIAGMVTRPLIGVWVDAGNRQRWLRLGAAGTVVAFAGYALDLGAWGTLPFRMVHGVSMGLFTTALLAIVASTLPADRRGLGVGIYQSSNAMAGLYAAVTAAALINGASFEAAFAVSGAAAALALVFGMLTGDPGADAERADGSAPPSALPMRQRRWISRSALVPAAVFLCLTTPFGAINAFLPLFATERDLGNVGLFYTAVALAQLASRAGAGALSDRFGRGAVIVPGLLAASAGLMLLAAAQSQAELLAAALLYGLGLAGAQTTIVALIVDRTPRTALGSAMATYTMAWDVGAVLGSVLLGFVANATSYATVYTISAFFPLLGVVLFVMRVRQRPGRAAPAAVEPVEAKEVAGG
ncbi:MAG: MFS transporter [Dehalococcoidia bacterium]|nr:MFS transporter [Dehalococcoidia bacterium]